MNSDIGHLWHDSWDWSVSSLQQRSMGFWTITTTVREKPLSNEIRYHDISERCCRYYCVIVLCHQVDRDDIVTVGW